MIKVNFCFKRRTSQMFCVWKQKNESVVETVHICERFEMKINMHLPVSETNQLNKARNSTEGKTHWNKQPCYLGTFRTFPQKRNAPEEPQLHYISLLKAWTHFWLWTLGGSRAITETWRSNTLRKSIQRLGDPLKHSRQVDTSSHPSTYLLPPPS